MYIHTDLYRGQCAKYTYIFSTHSVLLDILTVINSHYTPYVHILHYVHIYTHNMRRCSRLYIILDTQCHGCALHGIQWWQIDCCVSAVCACSPVLTMLEFELKCSAWHNVKWECAVGCISFFSSLA